MAIAGIAWSEDGEELQRAGFRDLGGYPTRGAETASGLLYRSASLDHLSERSRRPLRALGLRAAVDLRSPFEVTPGSGWEASEQLRRFHHPVAPAATQRAYHRSMPTGGVQLGELYHSLVVDGGPAFAKAFTDAVQHMPAVVYCTGGRDRSGILAALLLAVAGCDDAVIATEYAWSSPETGTAPIEDVLSLWRDRWGGPDRYLVAHGVSTMLITSFRRRFAHGENRRALQVVVNLQRAGVRDEPAVRREIVLPEPEAESLRQ